MLKHGCLVLLALLGSACSSPAGGSWPGPWPGLRPLLDEAPVDPQARGLDGRELGYDPPKGDALELQARLLEEAADRLELEPDSEDSWIWVGRRLAYLGRYRAAQRVYTRGLATNPGSYRLLRHRGHRWLTLREFTRAAVDLAQAERLSRSEPDRVEPDGLPNEAGLPTGTDRTNITYHLALALYVKGDFAGAARWWQA